MFLNFGSLTEEGLESGESVLLKDAPLLPDVDDPTHRLSQTLFSHSAGENQSQSQLHTHSSLEHET